MASNSPLLLEIGQGLSIMVGLPRIPTWTSEERPKNAKKGLFGFNKDTSNLEYCDGNGWLACPMKRT